jgi:hypothetical protein
VPTIADAFAWYSAIGVRCCAIAPELLPLWGGG